MRGGYAAGGHVDWQLMDLLAKLLTPHVPQRGASAATAAAADESADVAPRVREHCVQNQDPFGGALSGGVAHARWHAPSHPSQSSMDDGAKSEPHARQGERSPAGGQ